MYAVGDRLRLFDFGDAQWAFAFEAMCVPYGWIAEKNAVPWEPVRDAYREHWSDLVTPREYDALWHAATITHSVNRSAVWWRGIQGCVRGGVGDVGRWPAHPSGRSPRAAAMTPQPLDPSPWVFDPREWPDDDCVAGGADLEPGTIIEAYRHGAFPMPHDGQLLWWSPMRRGVLEPDTPCTCRARCAGRCGGSR